MSKDFQAAHDKILQLIEHFAAYASTKYLKLDYQEAEARKDFIDPMFKALGWDVDHERERNPYEQEVKVERSVLVARAQKRADYAFYLKPNFRDVRFFVEAKKPSVDLLRNADAHFQTLRYGYSANTPLAILTDFEQIVVLDCRRKPHPETATSQIHRSWYYLELRDPARFAEFYWLFSREAHADGSWQRRIEELRKPKGGPKQRGLFPGRYQPVDESFLADLEEYRTALARAFKKADDTLDSETLTAIVQRTLDRLVFLRFLEDKQIETDIRVSDFGKGKGKGKGAWADFQSASRRLDNIYNGIVFKRVEPLDDPGFVPDDDVFANISERLAAENAPYNFDAIPIHILGSIYERFLGSVIRATAKQVKVEEKPEVRKAGGVYYTPEYIVHYIVASTVGKLIAGKTPAEIAKLRFADIACGSGSFLLGIYDELLRYHADWYNRPEKAKQAKKDGCKQAEDGLWRLSLAQRRAILQHNVYGVDIDRQAVEVAQLSLFLKLLEDERATSARQYQLDYARDPNLKKLLPDLSSNIVCGNSLIGFDTEGVMALNDTDLKALNPLDFDVAFAQIMRAGGFDAVVGNPPYVRPHNVEPLVKKLLWARYNTYTRKADIYCCFMEKATSLLQEGGKLSFIVSKGWMQLDSFHALRQHLLSNYRIERLIETPFRVFDNAQVDTGIFALGKCGNSIQRDENKIQILLAQRSSNEAEFRQVKEIEQAAFARTYKNVFDTSISPATDVIKHRMEAGPRIGEWFDVSFGIKTGDDSKFLHKEPGKHPEDRKLLRGDDIFRYGYKFAGEYVWYAPAKMRSHRGTARPGTADRYERPKVLVKDTTKDFGSAMDTDNYFVKDVLVVAQELGKESPYSLGLLLAILNSRLMKFYYRSTFPTLHVQAGELASLPLPPRQAIANVEMRNRLTNLAVELTRTAVSQVGAKSDSERELARRKCAALDRQIDTLVYELYGLTDEEIRLIEGSARD